MAIKVKAVQREAFAGGFSGEARVPAAQIHEYKGLLVVRVKENEIGKLRRLTGFGSASASDSFKLNGKLVEFVCYTGIPYAFEHRDWLSKACAPWKKETDGGAYIVRPIKKAVARG